MWINSVDLHVPLMVCCVTVYLAYCSWLLVVLDLLVVWLILVVVVVRFGFVVAVDFRV